MIKRIKSILNKSKEKRLKRQEEMRQKLQINHFLINYILLLKILKKNK